MKSVLVFAGKTEYVTVLKTTVIASGKKYARSLAFVYKLCGYTKRWAIAPFFTFVDVL